MLQVVAVALEDLGHHVAQRLALGAVIARSLGDEQRGVDAVLVAHKGAGEIAIAFLKAEEEGMAAGILELLNLFADKLEARQRVEQRHAEVLADGARQLGGHDALDHGAVGRQLALRLFAAEDVVEHQAADLIAGQQAEAAVLLAHRHAQTVAVRVGAEDGVRAHLVGQLDGQREGGGVLRIGHFDGGEIGVGRLLLLDHAHVGDADFAQDAAHGHVAAAMDGGVDDLEVLARLGHDLGVDGKVLTRAIYSSSTSLLPMMFAPQPSGFLVRTLGCGELSALILSVTAAAASRANCAILAIDSRYIGAGCGWR